MVCLKYMHFGPHAHVYISGKPFVPMLQLLHKALKLWIDKGLNHTCIQ